MDNRKPRKFRVYEDYLACDYKTPGTPLQDLLESPALPAWEISYQPTPDKQWLETNDPGGKTFKFGKRY
jgi:hypothetical protein